LHRYIEEKKNSNDYILFPEREQKLFAFMDLISKNFSSLQEKEGLDVKPNS